MKRSAFLLLVPLIVSAVGMSIAHAQATPSTKVVAAGAGNPVPASAFSCFPNIWNGSVTNGCSTTQYWEVDFPTLGISNQTTPQATARVTAPAGGVSCNVVTMSRDLTVFNFGTPAVSTGYPVAAESLSLPTPYELDRGSAYFSCSVAPSARLLSFSWNLY